jgi:hypothetical protein
MCPWQEDGAGEMMWPEDEDGFRDDSLVKEWSLREDGSGDDLALGKKWSFGVKERDLEKWIGRKFYFFEEPGWTWVLVGDTTRNFGFCNFRLQLKFNCMWHMQLQICVVA